MGICGGTPAVDPPPPTTVQTVQTVLVAPLLVDPPEERTYTSFQMYDFLQEHYRETFPAWQRNPERSLLDDLTRLMTHPPDHVFRAMAVGYKESALAYLCNIERRTAEALRAELPALTSPTMMSLARDSLGKGYCQYVAPWLAHYLRSVNGRTKPLRDIRGLGNHACTTVRDEGHTIIVDGTWRQFSAAIGIETEIDELPTILVGRADEIGAILKQLGARNTPKAKALVAFYGGNPDQLA